MEKSWRGSFACDLGTNDLVNGISTHEKLQKMVDILRRESSGSNIDLLSVVTCSDSSGMQYEIVSLNSGLKTFCSMNEIKPLGKSNLYIPCFGTKKLFSHISSRFSYFIPTIAFMFMVVSCFSIYSCEI